MGGKAMIKPAGKPSGGSKGTHGAQAERAPIRHRRTTFDFSNVPAHWLGGDPFMSRLIDALSINFPDGERFFMDSVRNYEKLVTDPKLREDIRLFVRQEAQHGFVHEQFNAMMEAQGLKAGSIVRALQNEMKLAQKYLPKKFQLAITAAAEHLTATLGEGLLELMPEILADAHPEMRAMYAWHAVEEVEHKAVAFDVYQDVAHGDYFTRAAAMIAFTLYLHYKVARIMRHMLRTDGVRVFPRVLGGGLWKLYGPGGIVTTAAPRYLLWFKPGFHPWDTRLPKRAATWMADYEMHQDPHQAADAAFADVLPPAHAA